MDKPYNRRRWKWEPVTDEYTTIRVSKDTKKRLESHGEMNMSYDDVIQHVLDRLEKLEDQDDE